MAERADTVDRVVPAEVSGLLEERSRIRGWVERLVELKEEATPAVFERVREDYESRLADVGRRLSAHREDLEGSLATHREKVDGLQAERDERAAELEEAKLRFTVGEYDDAEWSRRRESCEAELARLDGRLEDGRAAVAELTGVLEALMADGPSPAVGNSSPAAVAATSPKPALPAPTAARAEEVEGPPEEVDGRSAEAAESPRAEDAETRERSEVMEGRERSAGARAAGGEVDREKDGAEGVEDDAELAMSDEAEFLDELEFLESLSLDDAERFDAVSAMLEGKGEEEGSDEGKEGRR